MSEQSQVDAVAVIDGMALEIAALTRRAVIAEQRAIAAEQRVAALEAEKEKK